MALLLLEPHKDGSLSTLEVVTTCWCLMWFSVLCFYSVQCLSNKPQQTRGVTKGKAGSERFLILPKVW